MSLLVMSPNMQEADATVRKRCHDEFAEPTCSEAFRFETSGFVEKPAAPVGESESKSISNGTQFAYTCPCTNLPLFKEENQDSRAPTVQHSPARFTESRGTPPQSPVPNATPVINQDISTLTTSSQTPTAPSSSTKMPAPPPTAEPPAKKKRLTKEEKAAKDEEMARKKQEREAEKAAKAAERARKDAEKAQKDAERKQKVEQKEKERRMKEEEEARKASKQRKLNAFFTIKPTTPKKTTAPKIDHCVDAASPAGTPSKDAAKEPSAYEVLFQPFFVKEQVSLARIHDTDMDEETRETKSRILDEYIHRKRGEIQVKPFDPVETLRLPCLGRRGRSYPSVRKIMAEFSDDRPHKALDLSTESQNTQIRHASEALRAIPMKLLSFKEDVRPPYYGTVTNYPSGMEGLRRLGRNPLSKDILPLAYDYDSEAEWQDDDGEDIEALDDDDDDPDNDEDMDDFLDDSEDAGLIRPAFGGGLEPESSGIRWENCPILPPSPHMYKFRMEFILGKS